MKTERLVATFDRNRPETVSLNVLHTRYTVRENLAFEASALGVDI